MKVFLLIIFALTTSVLAQIAKHPFTFEDMMKLKRVGAPVPSPDGKWVVFDCDRCGSGGEHEDFAFMDRAGERGRIAAVEPDAESRGAAALFARRQTADLDIESD